MYPVPAVFTAATLRGHKAIVKVELWQHGSYVAPLPVISGAVTLDGARPVRASMSLSVAGEDMLDAMGGDLLFPATAQLRPHRGISLPYVGDLYVPLGVFTFDDLELSEGRDGIEVNISANDLSARYSASLSTNVVVVDAGSTVTEAIGLVLSALDSAAIDDKSSGSSWVTPQVVYQPGTDLWSAAVSIATAHGKQLYLSRTGVPTLDDIPDPQGATPHRTFNIDDGAVVTNYSHVLSTQNTYNGVIASGEGTDLVRPLKAEAWVTDPDSPFYYLGPYGKKPYFYSSPLLLELAQVESAASALLKKMSGATQSLSWSTMPDPSLDPFDVIEFSRERTNISDTFLVDTVTIPLNPEEPMSLVGRNSAPTSVVEA